VARFVRERLIQNETGAVARFLDSDEVQFRPTPGTSSNTFVSDDGLEIVVGTVHSVKGETHTATLLLETFYYALDSKRLLAFFEGEYPESDRMKSRHIQNLKIAHVALSRPTHLAAFACKKANIAGHETALERNGWVIKDVSDILANGR
jgi:DNA helicase II / ATP-dependent DNA helicase PcrA